MKWGVGEDAMQSQVMGKGIRSYFVSISLESWTIPKNKVSKSHNFEELTGI